MLGYTNPTPTLAQPTPTLAQPTPTLPQLTPTLLPYSYFALQEGKAHHGRCKKIKFDSQLKYLSVN